MLNTIMHLIRRIAVATVLGFWLGLYACADTPPTVQFSDGTVVRKLSPLPPPGVHPRIFLSPEDLPELRRLATNSPARQRYYEELRKVVKDSLDTPTAPEGRLLAAVAKGETPSPAQFAAAPKLGYNLSLAAIDAQVVNDEARGKLLGKLLSLFGANQCQHWVRPADPIGLHNGWDAGFCLAYDFLAPWMSEAERAPARRFIAKMADGINLFTHDWPPHMRMWNWAGAHVYQGWGTLAIEGEEGWNPKLWNQAREIARDLCRYNIHPSGALTEDLTYFTLGFGGSGEVMMAMAKRGETEIWADGSNISKLKYSLINQLHPWGGGFSGHQDGVGDGFYATWIIYKFMYPTDPMIDYLWRERAGPNYDRSLMGNDASTRVWRAVLFGMEYSDKAVAAAEFKLPDTYFCPNRSYLITRTGWDTNALKLDFEAKTDYPTVGHNHADANNFTFAALGREWAIEAGYHAAAGHLHNNVVIDGRSESGWPTPGGRWVDLVDTPEVTIGVSDASHAYTWQWSNSGYGTENAPPTIPGKWELETLPEVLEFVRAQVESGKGSQTIFEHYGPVIRSEWNRVEKAFRSALLVRGNHPYALIVDDIRKDDQVRLYEWAMQMPADVEIIKSGERWAILGAKEMPLDKNAKSAKPQPDKRRLLVQIVDVDMTSSRDGLAIALESTTLGNDAFGPGNLRKRLVIPTRAVEPRFKILLYPHLEGDALPDVVWNEDHSACDLGFPEQNDRLVFASAAEGRTAMTVSRDGRLLATLKAAPAAPELLTTSRVFTDRQRVEFALPGAAQEIHYTLDGGEPNANSPLYARPFEITADTLVKAATLARRWPFGEPDRSAITEAHFTKQTPRLADGRASNKPGLNAKIYSGYWNQLPNFSKLPAIGTNVVAAVALPPGTPAKGFGVVLEGELRVPADGVYTLALRCDDAARLWIGDELVVDHDGQHIVSTKTGQIALAAGTHRLRIAHCDGALALGTGKGDGSWAFQALWAPAGAALVEIPATALGRASGPDFAGANYPKVNSERGAQTVPGLVYSTYDRSAQVGTPAFFDTAQARLFLRTTREAIVAPDSAPGLLNVYEGFLAVPHDGVYEFKLDAAGAGELTLGETVAVRNGVGEPNLNQPVELESGLVPFTLKLGKSSASFRWRGPGMAWQAVTSADLVRQEGAVAVLRQHDLLGCWSAANFKGAVLPNSVKGGAGDFTLPEGTRVVDDAEVGKAIKLDHSSMIKLGRTAILNNELTVSFRIKSDQDCMLFRYGYAHTGVFAGLKGGDFYAGGGRVWNAAQSQGGLLKDGRWHRVTATFGGSPFRQIRVFVDGVLQGEGRSPAPCLTEALEFLQGFSGLLAEIRMYNRVLAPEEIAALNRSTHSGL